MRSGDGVATCLLLKLSFALLKSQYRYIRHAERENSSPDCTSLYREPPRLKGSAGKCSRHYSFSVLFKNIVRVKYGPNWKSSVAKDAEDGTEGSRMCLKKYIYIKEKSNQPLVYTSRAWVEREREPTTLGMCLGDIWRQLIKGWLTRRVCCSWEIRRGTVSICRATSEVLILTILMPQLTKRLKHTTHWIIYRVCFAKRRIPIKSRQEFVLALIFNI